MFVVVLHLHSLSENREVVLIILIMKMATLVRFFSLLVQFGAERRFFSCGGTMAARTTKKKNLEAMGGQGAAPGNDGRKQVNARGT